MVRTQQTLGEHANFHLFVLRHNSMNWAPFSISVEKNLGFDLMMKKKKKTWS